MALYELSNVSRYYLVDKKKKYVLKDISLSLPYHGFITILGKSGSGKSTLLNMLGKIDSPSEGKIYFNNQDFSKYKEFLDGETRYNSLAKVNAEEKDMLYEKNQENAEGRYAYYESLKTEKAE